MTAIAVLSDIHGNLPALQAVAQDIERRGIGLVFNLGDLLSGPLWPLETLQFLQGKDWIHIRGNHDRQLVEREPENLCPSDIYAYQALSREDLEWLGKLPSLLVYKEEITLFHGTPNRDDRYLLERIEGDRIRSASEEEILSRLGPIDTQVVLCGHSHTPRVVYLPGGRLILNPGSVGLPAYRDEEPQPHRVEVGTPHARYALLYRVRDGWAVEQVLLDYNNGKAARRARLNNRPEWAQALETGKIQ